MTSQYSRSCLQKESQIGTGSNGFRIRTPFKTILPRPDWPKARKTRRIRKIRRVVEHLPEDEVAYYQDEVDVHLNPKIGRDWMLRGQQKGVVTPGPNKKRYLYGALAVDGNDFVYTTSRRKNSDGFVVFLDWGFAVLTRQSSGGPTPPENRMKARRDGLAQKSRG